MTVIKQLNVRRYGKFERQVFTFASGLNVVFGDNEAGKTTIQTFTYQMLTEFPSRRSRDITYFPADGDPSGVVVLADGERECSVDRNWRDLKVGGADLNDMLHGADAMLLNSVFCIRHRDIQEFGLLDDDAQRDRVFSAGVVGAGTSARQVMTDLANRAERLGGRNKRKGKIVETVALMSSIETDLNDARQAMEGHPDLSLAVQSLENDLSGLRSQESTLRTELKRASLLQDLQAIFNEVTELDAQIGADEPSATSAEVVSRAADLDTQIRELTLEVASIERESNAIGASLAGVSLNEGLWARSAEIGALSLSLAGMEEKRSQADVVRQEVVTLRKAVDDCGAALGTLSADDAERFEFSVQLRGELDAFTTQIPRAEDALRVAERVAQGTLRAAEEAAARLELLPAVELGSAPNGGVLDDIDDLIERLRALDAERGAFDATPKAGGAAPRFAASATFAVISVVAFAAGSAATGSLLALIAAAVLVAAYVARRRQHLDSKRVEEARAAVNAKQTQLEREASPLCETVGLSWPPDRHMMRIARRNVETTAHAAVTAAAQHDERTKAEARLEEMSSAHAAANHELLDATRELSRLQASWAEWLQRSHLPMSTPAITKDLLREVARFQDLSAQLRSKQSTLTDFVESLQTWETTATAALELLAVPGADSGSRVRIAATMVAAEAARRVEYKQLDAALAAKAAELQKAEDRRDALAEQLREVFASHGVDDLAELDVRRVANEARARLARRRDEGQTSIRARIGHGETADAHLRSLSGGDEARWSALVAECEAGLRDLEPALEQLIEARTDAKTKREALETSCRIPELALELETARMELVSAVDEWRQLLLANELIGSSLKKYRAERQPDVLKEARRYFSRATVGAYDAILLDDDTDNIVVREAATGVCRDLSQLSSGTEEPLYLSMRLGLAAELSRNSGSLPVMMDDVLVNMSRERRQAMIRAIAEFAIEQQVIFFTCHDHILAEFEDFATPHVVLLDDGTDHDLGEAA